jgi:glycosyltransferase involved in cell wall biosynthesis
MTPAEDTSYTIGIDARAAVEVPAGRGRVVRELLRELASRQPDGRRYVLYARQPWHELPPDDRFRWRLFAAADPWWHVLTARAANRESDVFLSTNSYLTIWFLRIPGVPIVYDMITFEPSLQPNRRSMLIERVTVAHAIRRSAAIIAISGATANMLAERFPLARAKTTVAPLGVARTLAPHGRAARELPPEGFVLAVGTLEPRKNLPRLVQAYASLPRQVQAEHPLVVAGALGWATADTLGALSALGDRCTMLGYVSDGTLAELYRRCAVFCYPSLGEGFGLPVLEAMACGAAVVTSGISSLPEVGGQAVEYIDPENVPSIAAGIARILGDESRRAELAARAKARAAEFSWTSFAAIVLETLDRAAAVGGAGGAPIALEGLEG